MQTNYFQKWNLENLGQIAQTPNGVVFKVRRGNDLAALKVWSADGIEMSRRSSTALRHFDGHGAVRLIDVTDGAQLLEFIDGSSLEKTSDERSAEVIAEVVQKVHSNRQLPSAIITLQDRFEALFRGVDKDPLFETATDIAVSLLNDAQEQVLLHGDIHHANILESQTRGWLAIDPQGLVGERAYDLANTFYNPEDVKQTADRIRLYADIFAQKLNLDRQRILQFAFCHGCLSACWKIEDKQDPQPRLETARLILSLLN